MELTLKTIIPYLTVLLTGLSAGFFYAWAVSVIPGTRRVGDFTYLETMQSINRAILNPAFFLIFFGSLVLLIAYTIQEYQTGRGLSFWLVVAAALFYLIGTFGVTAFGNVPLNEWLDVMELGELSQQRIAEIRRTYEVKWNQLHMIRTVCSVLSLLILLLVFLKN